MIRDGLQRERVMLEIERLEKLVKAGTASDIDRSRLRDGELELLCWDWEQQAGSTQPEETIPPPPVAVRFAEFYRRNQHHPAWRCTDWKTAWLYWSAPQQLAFEVDEHEVERALAVITTPTLRAA